MLNRRFGTDFEIDAFEHVALYDREREWIEMRVRALRPTSASLGDSREILFRAGDEIRTEISRKFSRRSFVKALDGTGLELAAWFTDPAVAARHPDVKFLIPGAADQAPPDRET